MNITVSRGNSKMGDIPSVSLPSGVTCRHDCECCVKCYARKLERFRPSVKESYIRNLQILNCTPEVYWREVEATIMTNRFFRFHVSGDIPNIDYFRKMIEIAVRNPHCEILCFTKKYEIVNQGIGERLTKTLPKNLHIIMSAWRGLKMNNPYNLPEAHVLYKDGTTTAKEGAKPCGGNCTNCFITEGGCWSLQEGEQVLIREH